MEIQFKMYFDFKERILSDWQQSMQQVEFSYPHTAKNESVSSSKSLASLSQAMMNSGNLLICIVC